MDGFKGNYGFKGNKGIKGTYGPMGLEGIEGTKVGNSFLARHFEEKKSSYCRHSGVSVWVGLVLG